MKRLIMLSAALWLSACATTTPPRDYQKDEVEQLGNILYDKQQLTQGVKTPVTGTVRWENSRYRFIRQYQNGHLRYGEDRNLDDSLSAQVSYDAQGLRHGKVLNTEGKASENGEERQFRHGILSGSFHEWHGTSGLVYDRTFNVVAGIKEEQLSALPKDLASPLVMPPEIDLAEARRIEGQYLSDLATLDSYDGWAWHLSAENSLSLAKYDDGRQVALWIFDKHGFLRAYRAFKADSSSLRCELSEGKIHTCFNLDSNGFKEGLQYGFGFKEGKYYVVQRQLTGGLLDGTVKLWHGDAPVVELAYDKGVRQDNQTRLSQDLGLAMPWLTPQIDPSQSRQFFARFEIPKDFTGWARLIWRDGGMRELTLFRDGVKLENWQYGTDRTLFSYQRFHPGTQKAAVAVQYRDGLLSSYQEKDAKGHANGRKLTRAYRQDQYRDQQYKDGRQVGKAKVYQWDEQGQLIHE
ncbi:hypothetical protein [Gallaecimonas xiamenensis]|uniref:Lipoprotein n=1 Tax=Gallaecimonas xiamenensis 3-C-1 TaxID=745411 RepID=K2JLF8_9GAMM|nr:hypothetical protein [Gallaecimonas xiamenensis]EKE75232.1 hypothetical protein B3C1_08146 [Gallaecimonas xiamenensis 3-C-1]